jgi:hypothetical protein
MGMKRSALASTVSAAPPGRTYWRSDGTALLRKAPGDFDTPEKWHIATITLTNPLSRIVPPAPRK